MPKKLHLAHLPTPLTRSPALDRLIGAEVWIKRDDMTSGAAAGNKIRKLEYLLAHARSIGATTIITCGGQQSNHARATALCCAELGLKSVLLLRTPDPAKPPAASGNLLLDGMVGAQVRFITPDQYSRRGELMAEVNRELEQRGERPYIIPEGGSNGRGSLGYVDAMREVAQQLEATLGGGPRPFDAVALACGSGGTAAGVALGVKRYGVAEQVLAMAVCDDKRYFDAVIERIVREAVELDPALDPSVRATVFDTWKGPAYGIPTQEQLDFLVEVARKTGLIFDPVYTGKALFGLSRLESKPARVLFLHTGGLPGLLAESDLLASRLS